MYPHISGIKKIVLLESWYRSISGIILLMFFCWFGPSKYMPAMQMLYAVYMAIIACSTVWFFSDNNRRLRTEREAFDKMEHGEQVDYLSKRSRLRLY